MSKKNITLKLSKNELFFLYYYLSFTSILKTLNYTNFNLRQSDFFFFFTFNNFYLNSIYKTTKKKNFNKKTPYWLSINKFYTRNIELLLKRCVPTVFFKKYLRLKSWNKKLWFTQRLKINFLKFFILINKNFKKKLENFSLLERTFLTKKIICNKLTAFLFKKTKNYFVLKNNYQNNFYAPKPNNFKKKKIYFFNANKSLIWKMRFARFAHWDLKTRGKINKYRYDKLLCKDLRFLTKTHTKSLFLLVLFNYYNLIISWKQALNLLSYQLIIVNGQFIYKDFLLKKGDIVELSYGSTMYKFNKQLKSYFKVITRQAKRRNYIQKNKSFTFYNKNAKKIPKIFKKTHIGLINLGVNIVQDPIFKSFLVLNYYNSYFHDPVMLSIKSSVLGLQNWRYNFD